MKSIKRIAGVLAVAAIATSLVLSTGCKNEKKEDKKDSTATATPTPPKPRQNASDSIASAMAKTTVEFEKTQIDYGKVKEGEKANYEFKFKNTGTEPLTITNARGSCGCTVPDWPKEPIKPGESGVIKAQFDSKGKPGKQTKTVTVTANTEPINTTLTITADVEADPNAPKPAAPAASAQPNIQVTPAGGEAAKK